MEPQTVRTWKILSFDGNSFTEKEDDIVDEFPLTFRLDGEEFATVLCSPTDLEDLAVGFLASEGVIRFMEDIEDMAVDAKRGFADVRLKRKRVESAAHYSKRFIGSCCGKSRQFYFHNDVQTARTVLSKTKVPVGSCFRLMKELQETSADFRQTGGVHNAAICGKDGIIAVRSDIGRHNALDKIFGYCLRNRLSATDKIIAFSGRLSSEVVLKAAKIGSGILLSKSAPTRLALELAGDLGITAVGFIRGSRLNVYTHPERIEEEETP